MVSRGGGGPNRDSGGGSGAEDTPSDVCIFASDKERQKKENGDYDEALTVLNFARGVGERLEGHQRLGVWLHLCRHQVVRTLQQHRLLKAMIKMFIKS